jgi:hypothetical protein
MGENHSPTVDEIFGCTSVGNWKKKVKKGK